MKFEGSISLDIVDFEKFSVGKSGKSNGLIYVPKTWIGRDVMVLLLPENKTG